MWNEFFMLPFLTYRCSLVLWTVERDTGNEKVTFLGKKKKVGLLLKLLEEKIPMFQIPIIPQTLKSISKESQDKVSQPGYHEKAFSMFLKNVVSIMCFFSLFFRYCCSKRVRYYDRHSWIQEKKLLHFS